MTDSVGWLLGEKLPYIDRSRVSWISLPCMEERQGSLWVPWPFFPSSQCSSPVGTNLPVLFLFYWAGKGVSIAPLLQHNHKVFPSDNNGVFYIQDLWELSFTMYAEKYCFGFFKNLMKKQVQVPFPQRLHIFSDHVPWSSGRGAFTSALSLCYTVVLCGSNVG